MNRTNHRDTRTAYLMLAPFLLFFALFVLYPAAMTVYYSFTSFNLKEAAWVGLKNYRRLLRDEAFLAALRNTAVFAAYSIVSLTVLGFLAAAAMNRAMKGVKWMRMLMIFPYATSMTAISMIWLMMFDAQSGFLNKFLRLLGASGVEWLFNRGTALGCLIFVIIWKNIGYCMLIYLSGMQSIDDSLYEAATVDGASGWTQLWRITLPMVRPVVFFVLITTTVDAFKTFEQVQIMTRGDPLYATTTLVHQIYLRGFTEFKMGYASAMAVVLLAIISLVTALSWGLNRGGERG